ncbi:MAG: Divergent AAA domain protein [Bacteroidetes bacterium ADurb.BinA104]|nr:MAG: Divergent AAA domain protein [Bacteroidetes bacterium ADurb.BinA104]
MFMNKYIESETLELKAAYTDSSVRDIVAFLNASGGTLYFGIADDGTIKGVQKIDETLRKIADIVSSQIEPNPADLIRARIIYEESKPIIEVTVSKGFFPIYCVKKYGFSQAGCPIRIGSSCKEMTPTQIQVRYQKRFESSKDYMTAIPAKYGDISFNTLQIALSNQGYHINKHAFEINYNLRNKDNDYNLLAELLSDQNMISLIIVKFRGKDKSSISERTDLGRTSLITAYYNMKNRLIAENICMSDTTIRPRKDTYLYDIDAVDEALINALVHNDWSISEPLVSMFDDRLEILSLGGLPYKQTREQFLKGISIPRNSTLMRIFQDLDIAEHTGHGIPKILQRYGEEVFDITDNYIKVVIPFDPLVRSNHGNINGNISDNIIGYMNQELTVAEQAVLELLVFNPKATQAEAAAKVGVSKRTISRIFASLQERGYVTREGSNKTGIWKVVKS